MADPSPPPSNEVISSEETLDEVQELKLAKTPIPNSADGGLAEFA